MTNDNLNEFMSNLATKAGQDAAMRSVLAKAMEQALTYLKSEDNNDYYSLKSAVELATFWLETSLKSNKEIGNENV